MRYEDLVDEPERELRRLCGFLDEPFCEEMLEHHRRSESGFARTETHKARTFKPVTTSRVGRYRKHLSRSDIAVFQAIAGAELRAHGYELDRVPPLLGYIAAIPHMPTLVIKRLRWLRKRGEMR